MSTENATRQLARLSFKEHDIPALLSETQTTARIFLDAMQKSVNLQTTETENVDVPENNPLLKEIGIIQVQGKVEQTPESELKLKEEPFQLGLFDDYTATQTDSSNETKSIVFEEEISVAENVTAVGDDTATDTATNEQGNSDYDFEEMDEEEEILPSTIEKQSKVEFLTAEDSQSENISPESNSEQTNERNQTSDGNFNPETPPKDATPDLQTILAEDMLAIRGNSVEKNIFRKNVIAIRTLQHIEREKSPPQPLKNCKP